MTMRQKEDKQRYDAPQIVKEILDMAGSLHGKLEEAVNTEDNRLRLAGLDQDQRDSHTDYLCEAENATVKVIDALCEYCSTLMRRETFDHGTHQEQ